jgi:hypothetical protein
MYIGKKPYNRLQEHHAKIVRRWLIITLVLVSAFCASLLAAPAFADAPAGSNPTNAPGWFYTPPSQSYVGGCAAGPSACPVMIWFSATNPAQHGGAPMSCVIATVSGGTQVSVLSFSSPSSLYLPGFVNCWDGSAWVTSGAGNYTLSHGALTTTIGTNEDLAIIGIASGGYNAAFLANYSLVLPTTGGQIVVPKNIDFPLLDLINPSAAALGSPVPFILSWARDFDVYYITAKKDSSFDFSYPISTNYPLGFSGTRNFFLNYGTAGTYTPTATVGNIHCNGPLTATGAMTGSGCLYVTATGTGLTIIAGGKSVPAWQNGGNSQGFNTNSGYLLQSDKTAYQIGETPHLRYFFSSPLHTIDTIEVRGDASDPVQTYILTGIEPHQFHQIDLVPYTEAGQYNPTITLTNSGGYMRTVYIGGNTTPNPAFALFVAPVPSAFLGVENKPIGGIIGITTESGTVMSASGSVLSPNSGQGSNAGIFGLDVFTTFTGFPTTNNEFLDAVSSVIFYVIKAAIIVAEYIFSLLQLSAFYSFLFGVIHPTNGTVLTFPCKFFNNAWNTPLCGTHFTVVYANYAGMQVFTTLLQVMAGFGFFIFSLKQFLFHKH